MAYSEAQNRATKKYQKENYDQIAIRVLKGTRERWKAAAESSGESLASFIADAVEQKIKNCGS